MKLSELEVERLLRNGVANFEFEGLTFSDNELKKFREVLRGDITADDLVNEYKRKYGYA